jgi:hypothetical protein
VITKRYRSQGQITRYVIAFVSMLVFLAAISFNIFLILDSNFGPARIFALVVIGIFLVSIYFILLWFISHARESKHDVAERQRVEKVSNKAKLESPGKEYYWWIAAAALVGLSGLLLAWR